VRGPGDESPATLRALPGPTGITRRPCRVVEELLREYIINNGGNPSWVHQTDMHFEALKIAARANPGDDTYEIPLWLPENAKTDWRSHLQADDAPLMRFNNQLESEYSAGAIFPRLLDHARHIELYAVHPTVIAGVQGVLDNFLDKAIAPAVTRLRRALFPITHKRRKVVSGTGAASGASNEMTG